MVATLQLKDVTGPHTGQSVLVSGEGLDKATVAMILVHGRGATADDILGLSREFGTQPGLAYLAPQAAGNTWYPFRYLEPLEKNEPYLSSALSVLNSLVSHINETGIPSEKIVLLGFSQGACLSLEYAARHARRYSGVVGLSGGLIGPEGTPRNYKGSLDNTPVFLGCSDVDFHIPKESVLESAAVLERLGGAVTAKLYPNMGHTINIDEVNAVKAILTTLKS